MATRSRKTRISKKKRNSNAFELTRLKLLYGLSGAFTLCVAGLLLARPAPLAGTQNPSALAAQSQDPLDSAIQADRGIDPAAWRTIAIERCDSLVGSVFHFAILPQSSGDQIAISAEWSRQVSFSSSPGELRIALISADPAIRPEEEKTIRLLVDRLRNRLRIEESSVVWRS